MNVDQIVMSFREDREFMKNVSYWKEIPAKNAEYAEFPSRIDIKLINALSDKGIHKLYTHQEEAVSHILNGENVTVVTPTASGKTLCYNIPVLNEISKDPSARALYIFPTKALAQDQMAELHELSELMDSDIKSYTYDGDTPVNARKAVRQAGNIVITNPDMLHSGILPQHTKWVDFFENLKYVVIDELHTYIGVFGSNVCNIMRRLRRLCAFYGSDPQFICLSATISNPKELAEKITGKKMYVVSKSGAPTGKRHIIFYNPPYVDKKMFVRRDTTLETRAIAERLLKNKIQTIVFMKSRVGVEVMLSTLEERLHRDKADKEKYKIKAYRGGYLPSERRAIEKGLRSGDILGVISTNALELGIDIGSLDASVMCGYPGGIANTWQQVGRAGRRRETSIAIMVASNRALDQYILKHSDYFFEASPEMGLLNGDNLQVLMSHVQCSLFELPFKDGETYDGQDISALLEYFGENGTVRHVGGKWHWMAESYPASLLNVRSLASDNFIIIDISDPKHSVIGEMDKFTVPMLLHEQAIYMHQGVQFQVEKLDWDDNKAYVRRVSVDYYTDADMNVEVKVTDVYEDKTCGKNVSIHYGEVMVICQTTMFKKMKLDTHENLGWGKIFLPQLEMYTMAAWMTLPEELIDKYDREEFNDAMLGITHLLGNITPVYLMSAPSDINIVYHVRSPFTGKPTVYIYDNYQGGIGFSEKIYHTFYELLEMAYLHVKSCECDKGCPSCVGPLREKKIKKNSLKIMETLINDYKSSGQA